MLRTHSTLSSHDLHAVFVSNTAQQVPLWHQRASTRADGLVVRVQISTSTMYQATRQFHQVWDYHVFVIQTNETKGALVWDPDTYAPPPQSTRECILKHVVVFHTTAHWVYHAHWNVMPATRLRMAPCCFLCISGVSSVKTPMHYAKISAHISRRFRVVEATAFLQSFSSDRRHMRGVVAGEWLAPPPPGPCIQGNCGTCMLPILPGALRVTLRECCRVAHSGVGARATALLGHGC